MAVLYQREPGACLARGSSATSAHPSRKSCPPLQPRLFPTPLPRRLLLVAPPLPAGQRSPLPTPAAPRPAPAAPAGRSCHSPSAATAPTAHNCSGSCIRATSALNTRATPSRSRWRPPPRPAPLRRPPTASLPPHPRAPPPRIPAPARARAAPSPPLLTRSGTLSPSPAHPPAPRIRYSHPPDTAPDLRSGTIAPPLARSNCPARTVLLSAPLVPNTRALLPAHRCTVRPPLPPAPPPSPRPLRTSACSLSPDRSAPLPSALATVRLSPHRHSTPPPSQSAHTH